MLRNNMPLLRPATRNALLSLGIPAVLLLLLISTAAWTPKPAPAREPQVGLPSVPVVLNGVRIAPEALNRYPGEDLHYVLDPRDWQLHVFTSPEQRDQYLRARSLVQKSGLTDVTLASTAGPTATFWENENRTGSYIQYSTSVFSLGGWSDVISSLETGTRSVRLWEHEGFRGASLTIPADVIVEDLGPFGWSDVASSLQFL